MWHQGLALWAVNIELTLWSTGVQPSTLAALSVWVDRVLEHSPVEAAVMAANAVGRCSWSRSRLMWQVDVEVNAEVNAAGQG